MKVIKFGIKREDEDEMASLPGRYPHLTPIIGEDKNEVTMKNIREDLKKHFPEIKFSVRQEHYGTVNVRWTDGPQTKSVDAITGKYEDSHSDITGDFHDYDPSLFNRVFGGKKFVFTNRDMSQETKGILNKWAEGEYETGDWKSSYYNAESLAYKLFSNNDVYPGFTIAPTGADGGLNEVSTFWKIVNVADRADAPEMPHKEGKPEHGDGDYIVLFEFEGMTVIPYSDKSVAVIGDTKPNKDILKELGGRFNARLACGPGWIFKTEDWKEIQAVLETTI